jgi:hypothetical protein
MKGDNNMRVSPILLTLTLCVAFMGCKSIYGPKQEVKAFIDQKEAVILAIGNKVEADPTPAGVDAARSLFEEKKSDLIAKREAIDKGPRGINGDWLTMLFQSNVNDTKYFDMIRAKLSQKMADTNTMDKFNALENDFEKTVSGN